MSQDKNAVRAQPDWPPVVVAGAYQTGVNLARNLERRGLKVYCIDNDRTRQGFRSIYGTTLQCPDPELRSGDWAAFMLELAGRLGQKPVLIPSADVFVLAMAQHADELRPGYTFDHDTVRLQGLLATKRSLYDLAARHSMPVSPTRFASSLEEVADFGQTADFPCIIKPARSYDWVPVPPGHLLYSRKVVLCTSAKDLEEKYRVIARVNPDVVVQQVIEGPDTAKLVYLSCYTGGGRRIGRCMVRLLRAAPMHFGNGCVSEPVEDAETDSLCDQFLKSLNYAGLCEIELKRDSRDGRVKMIEANPRYTGTSDAATYAGVDLGWLHYLDLIGQPVEMVSQNPRIFRHIALSWDFSAIGEYRRAGLLTWRDLIHSYRPPVAFYDLDLRDWRITAGTLFNLLYFSLGRPIRRLLLGARTP